MPPRLPVAALAAALLAAGALPQPAAAQAGPSERYTERYIEVYGNDPCPPSTDTEIVVCARKPESDRYRIPKAFRAQPGNGPNESWANKALALETTGRSGTASCSPSGAGGWTGCWSQLMNQARAARQQQAQENADVP